MNAFIRATGSFVPSRKVTNDELSKRVDTSDEWIVSHTGIRSRHIADDAEAASDLAVHAARAALAACGMETGEIDLILVATATPDFPGFPSTACIVQHALGAKKAGAMDMAAACTGFVYGLETARAFIVSGSVRNVLVIGAEVLSRALNWDDRNTCVLFGDGAGAVVVSADTNGGRGICNSMLRSDGSGARALERTAGGSRYPIFPGMEMTENPFIKMDGRKVYTFAVQAMCETITELLERNGLGVGDLSWIVPHQANVRIIEAAAKRLQIPQDKFFTNIGEYANTSAASIPIALDEMQRTGLLSRGQTILTVGFGGGLTWGGNLIQW